MDFATQKIYILGLGISGIAAARVLHKLGADLYLYDDQKAQEQLPGDLANLNYCHYVDLDWQQFDYLLISPGIPTSLPEPHPAVLLARQHQVKITIDIELFAYLIPKAKLIAITGTNGKSTTASLIHHLLKESGLVAYLGGNIGVPVFDLPQEDSADSYYVLELSSFQLELIERLAFDYAIWLNLTADHLDRHGDMQGYKQAKLNIFKNAALKAEAQKIIGIDDQYSKQVFNSEVGAKTSFSKDQQEADYYFTDNILHAKQEKFALQVNPALFGNKQNIIAAAIIKDQLGLTNEQFYIALQSFVPLKHRMQFLGQKNKVNFFNDSKATNAESTLNALKQLDDIFLILGGIAKEGGIEILLPELAKVKFIALIGESQQLFKTQLEQANYHNYILCADLAEAVNQSFALAQQENLELNLLFSPAAASFDMWQNFVARGNDFINIYEKI